MGRNFTPSTGPWWRSPHRALFWRYVGDLVLLRTGPMSHHLIEWGRVLIEESAAEDARVGRSGTWQAPPQAA